MISVAMATYNGEKYIKEQLESILGQDSPVDEIVICDDCSTDKTLDIIYQVIKDYNAENIIKVMVNKDNIGYIKNFLKALSMVSGDYIFLADQDDIWCSEKVRESLAILERTDAVALCTNSEMVNSKDEKLILPKEYIVNDLLRKDEDYEVYKLSFHKLIYGNVAQGCTYCLKKEICDKMLELNCTLIPHDYQIMLMASLMGDVLFYNRKLIHYRIHEDNTIGFRPPTRSAKKHISRKPAMVCFLEALNSVVEVKRLRYYKTLFYLRIPYLRYLVKNKMKR